MLTAHRHDEPNLLALLNRAKLRRLIENTASEHVAVATSDGNPYRLWLPVGNTRPTVVHDDLEVVRMLRKKTSFEFWMSAPVHLCAKSPNVL